MVETGRLCYELACLVRLDKGSCTSYQQTRNIWMWQDNLRQKPNKRWDEHADRNLYSGIRQLLCQPASEKDAHHVNETWGMYIKVDWSESKPKLLIVRVPNAPKPPLGRDQRALGMENKVYLTWGLHCRKWWRGAVLVDLWKGWRPLEFGSTSTYDSIYQYYWLVYCRLPTHARFRSRTVLALVKLEGEDRRMFL